MGYLNKFKKGVIFIICLFESWINYYHKKGDLIYVGLANLLFIIILDLAIIFGTYAVSCIIGNQLFIQGLDLFFIYMIALSIITFQNIFDDTFNIASKVKMLIFSLFEGLTIKRLLINPGIYCAICIGVLIWLGALEDKYTKKLNVVNPDVNGIANLTIIMAIMVFFTIYVYGINNSYSRNKRKLILYGIAALITFISTMDSVTEILNFKFISSLIGLILSIDRFANAYSGLMKEYDEKDKNSIERKKEICDEMNLTFEDIFLIIINWVNKIGIGVKNSFDKFRMMSNKKKFKRILRIVIVFVISCILTLLMLLISGFIIELGTKFIEQSFNYISYNIQFTDNGVEGVLWEIVRIICKLILVTIYIFIFIICFVYILISIENIRNEFKNKRSLEVIHKELGTLGISMSIFYAMIVIPLVILNIKIILITYIFKGILYIDLITIILWIIIYVIRYIANVICNITSSVKKKIEKYKKGK